MWLDKVGSTVVSLVSCCFAFRLSLPEARRPLGVLERCSSNGLIGWWLVRSAVWGRCYLGRARAGGTQAETLGRAASTVNIGEAPP